MESAYLDYAASNPVDPRVREAVLFALDAVGNPSSVHARGRILREAVDAARDSVARLLDVKPSSLVFTSGATEANNLALKGYFARLRETVPADRRLGLVISSIEHPSVVEAAKRAAVDYGLDLRRLPVDGNGVVRPDDLRDAIDDDTAMVSVMWANNVIGSLQPLREIAAVLAQVRAGRGGRGLPLVLMSDAVQALRTEDVRPADVGVDLMSLSGHKAYGPKGIGALYIGPGVGLSPVVSGGGQESGLRGGTENVPGIIGLGRAADILLKERSRDREHVAGLHARLLAGLRQNSRVTVHGDPATSIPGICFLSHAAESGDVLTLKLDASGLAVSSGSACEAGARKSSAALERILPGAAAKRGGLRVSFGRFSMDKEIDRFLAALRDCA